MAEPALQHALLFFDVRKFQEQIKKRGVIAEQSPVSASKSYRPTSKRIILRKSHFRPFVPRSERQTTTVKGEEVQQTHENLTLDASPQDSLLVESPRTPQPLDQTVLGGSFADPFASYPIEAEEYIPFLVDYFIRYLTPRFTPALGTETSRYITWFNVAISHPELFHALIALSQTYHHIDTDGFDQPHWRTLYHRGESLRGLRRKVESPNAADDDASILTALWLMDVDYSHADYHAYATHYRAKARMVVSRGGIRALQPELQDELLKSEYFLPLLLYGKLVCQSSKGGLVVRYRETRPVNPLQLVGLPDLFRKIAMKGLLTAKIAAILHQFRRPGPQCPSPNSEDSPLNTASNAGGEIAIEDDGDEIEQVVRLVETCRPSTTAAQMCLAMLIYIFNLHNQDIPQRRHLMILNKIAHELVCTEFTKPVGEREATIWTVIAIGAAASFSPWRREIPFMAHLIEWMNNDEDLHLLTGCIRGYYLYGASKEALENGRRWHA